MVKGLGVLAAVVSMCLAGAADAQEGTGAPVFRLRANEIQAVYPAAAKAKGLEGDAVVTCSYAGQTIWSCALVSETPAGEGFGEAALALVRRYEAPAPAAPGATPAWPQTIRIPFRTLQPGKTYHVGGSDYVLPRSVETPSADAVYEAWPRVARFSGAEGSASLWCTVAPTGRLEACAVSQESQPGQGFGEAALKLAPLYRFTPALRDGAPVAMSIPVTALFACDVRCRRFEGTGEATPARVAGPTPDEVQAVYPAAARARGLEGAARLDCMTTVKGALEDCRVVAETSPGEGFGTAALKLAERFNSPDAYPHRIAFPVAFDRHPGLVDRLSVDSRDMMPPMPPLPFSMPKDAPAEKAPVKGSSRLRCQVAQGGRMEGCIVLENTPPDPEVARQAMDVTDKLRARIWTDEGRSTIGALVELTLATGGFYPNAQVVIAPPAPPVVPKGVVDYRPQTLVAAPGVAERFYPAKAQRMEVSGRAVLTCMGVKDQHPDNCRVISESPADYGFGDAALKMSQFYRYSPMTIDGAPSSDPIQIPFQFMVP